MRKPHTPKKTLDHKKGSWVERLIDLLCANTRRLNETMKHGPYLCTHIHVYCGSNVQMKITFIFIVNIREISARKACLLLFLHISSSHSVITNVGNTYIGAIQSRQFSMCIWGRMRCNRLSRRTLSILFRRCNVAFNRIDNCVLRLFRYRLSVIVNKNIKM